MDNLGKLKSITDKALMISIIKMLVCREVNKKLRLKRNQLVKSKIDSKSNDFYKPKEHDLRTKDNFKSFISILSDKILYEIFS